MKKNNDLIRADILFEIHDIFGKVIRTTKGYWRKIIEEKHRELTVGHEDVVAVLQKPDEVYQSVQDEYIAIYYKKIGEKDLVILVKFVDETGFVVTCYQTTKTKRKGNKLWP